MSNVVEVTGVIGSIASVISLWLTWRVFIRVKNLEQRYLRLGVMPGHMKRLKGFTGNLEKAVRAKDADGMRSQLTLCYHVLNAICPLLKEATALPTRQLADRINKTSGSRGVELQLSCEEILIGLVGEHERLRLLAAEHQWRSHDGD